MQAVDEVPHDRRAGLRDARARRPQPRRPPRVPAGATRRAGRARRSRARARSPVTRSGVLRVHAGPVVTSIGVPRSSVRSNRARVPSCSRSPSHTAHHERRSTPTRACPTHSIASGPNAPTQRHDFRSAIGQNDMLRLTDGSVRRGRRTLVRAAAVQLQSTPDRDRNLEAADRLTRAAAPAGAELVVLPGEVARAGHAGADDRGAPSRSTGRSLQWARATARELGIDLVAGSFSERVEGDERGRNTSIHVGPDGELRASYRKIHMFDVEVGGRVYKESEHEAPGDEIVLSETADGVGLGLTHLLRRPLPRAVPDPRRPAARRSSPSRPRSRSPRRATTGRSCCAPARSRARRSSSPPTRSASTRRASAPAGAR